MRRQLLAALTAAFILFQQAIIFAPDASAQARRPALEPAAATRTTGVQRTTSTKTKTAALDDAPGGPNDTGTGSVSLTTLGSPVSETFNTLATSGTANTTLPTGWYLTESGNGARDNEAYGADNGGSTTGDIYSYGTAGTPPSTERALGELRSGTLVPLFGAKFTNNTGSTITTLEISYTGEQWRIGNTSTARDDRLDFQYSLNATDLSTGTWTDVNALDFTNPIKTNTTATALDGNNAANRTGLTAQILNLSIPNGASFFVRWTDLDASGADDGLAVDDFSITPQPAVLAPSLTVNDVSQDEGNAATTAFTFTVSLNDTLHSGVTFDICTADGTAQDGNPAGEDTDYQAKCLTNQTIPNGSNSYQFTVNVNGDSTTEPNETFFVNVTNVTNAIVSDGQGQGTIQNDDVTLTPIHDLQGNGATTPVPGANVATTGIVTLLKTGSNAGAGAAGGFFLQTPDAGADADPNTSEGIFVFTSTVPTVAVGDSVRVVGTVQEFNGLTEIGSVTSVSILSTGNTLPTAVTLNSTILDAAAASTQPQLEKYESMRLAASSLKTVAPNDSFFDVYAVLLNVARPVREPGIESGQPVPPDPTSGTPDANIAIWDKNPERLKVDTNGRAGAPNLPYTSNVTFTNISGPLDYAFGEYRLVADAAPSASANMLATAVPAPNPDEFTVAGYNIENFNNDATQRQKAANTIRNLLHSPDILGAVEIFDLADLQALRDQINADAVSNGDPDPQYEAYLVEQDGTSEDADQDVGFLVKTSRVQVNSVTQEREEETFINPVNGQPESLHDRPPLVLDAVVDPAGSAPQHVFVVVNHLRSFIDIEQVAGEGVRVREKRKKQAESIAGLLQELQTNNPGVPVISVGDYNAFQFSSGYDDPISVIKGNPTPDDQIVVDQSPDLVNPDFTNLIETLPAAERYSFVFEGTPQALDHHLVNAAARARHTRTAIARVNSDFPENPAATYASNAATPERNSDHDPVVSYYSLGAAQAAGSLIISEFRFRGPGSLEEVRPAEGGNDSAGGPAAPGTSQDNDEFIEFYNNTDNDITVSTLDGSAGWALVAADGQTRFIIPAGTVIAAHTHFLAINLDGYSLSFYAGGDDVFQPGDTNNPVGGYNLDIPNGSGIALFSTADPANFTLGNRLDAAGYAGVDALYREGAGFPTGGGEMTGDLEHSFVRRICVFGGAGCTGPAKPRDSGDNLEDFVVVNTDGASTVLGAKLGAPGPESGLSPIEGDAQLPGTLLDPSVSASQSPNRVRDFTSNPGNNSTFGTLSIRRTVTNNTGTTVRYLAFRIIDTTTYPSPGPGVADLRALDSDDIVVTVNGNPVDVRGTYVEQPPQQPNGGGLNTSLGVGYIDLEENALADGDSVNIQFLLGIQQTGSFRFYVKVEMLTDEVAPPPSPGSPLLPTSHRKLMQEQRVTDQRLRARGRSR